MSAVPSFKELSKALSTFMPHASLPLPDDVVEIIDGYLRKHDRSDESVADKVNEELLVIYHRDVASTPGRYAPFLNVLRRFRPLIGQPQKILKWWDLLLPVLDHLIQEKDLAAQARAIVLDILTADDGNDADSPTGGGAKGLAGRLVSTWMDDCISAGKGGSALEKFREVQLRETLIAYGKKRPRDFMTLLDSFVVRKSTRRRILHLTADFIRSQPPHLHQVLQTPLFSSLINCLQLDTSTTVVAMSLTSLTMLLPHMPSSLVPHLPTLFNVYARLLFWERELSAVEMGVNTNVERRISPSVATWDKMHYSPDFDDTAMPHLLDYFTILYGLYPINFMDYIRKPQRYLRHAEAPNADDIEVQPTEIRHASERFRQCHVLHENFYTLTIDTEKTDFGRWIKSEPAEVVADCMALCQEQAPELDETILQAPDQPMFSIKDDGERDGPESALLSSSVPLAFSLTQGAVMPTWPTTAVDSPANGRIQSAVLRQSSQSSHRSLRDSSSTRRSTHDADSPVLSGQFGRSGSQTQLQDMFNSNKAIKSGLYQSLANDSVPSLSLSQHESSQEKQVSSAQVPPLPQTISVPQEGPDLKAQLQHTYRQILLLHNDLIFERFMKQQHLTHMGELRRRQVREAASEAEMQNMIFANRMLKQRLEEAKKTELQVKKDSERSRALAKKWEADLSTKLRTIREDQKKWLMEKQTLDHDLRAAKAEIEELVGLVCQGEVRELAMKQSVQSVEESAGELHRLREEVQRLIVAERNSEARELEHQAALATATEASARAEMFQMKFDARETEIQQVHDIYESQIVTLNAKLQGALEHGSERNVESLKGQIESTMAASRAQQTELRERISELIRKNTRLNALLLDLQSSMATSRRSEPWHQSPAADVPAVPSVAVESGSPLSFRNRARRGFSDTEALEGLAPSASAPLEPFQPLTPVGSHTERPRTPTGTEPLGKPGKSSPTAEWYHGRGGAQNADKKDKDKEKKKAGGIRGIRGFV